MSAKKHTNVAAAPAEPPGEVWLPPSWRENKKHVVAVLETVPDDKQTLDRIKSECDPIGLAIAIATGQPVPTMVIKAGKLTVKYETLPLNHAMRERMIKWLGDKVQPRQSVRNTLPKTKQGQDEDPASDAEYDALVSGAAERADGGTDDTDA